MEEIICHACGRPNLPEAKKCWYCQEELESPDEEKSKDSAPEVSPSTQADAGDIKAGQPAQHPDETEEVYGEIPEWLKRIRDLKKVDSPPDEDEDRWQQQGLFNPAAAPIDGSHAAGTVKRSERPAPKPKHPAEQQVKQPPAETLPLEPMHEKEGEAVAQTDLEDGLSDELPDGFKPIDEITANDTNQDTKG